jgi:5,10-methylenetetrahydrofolate reductase
VVSADAGAAGLQTLCPSQEHVAGALARAGTRACAHATARYERDRQRRERDLLLAAGVGVEAVLLVDGGFSQLGQLEM